MHPDTYIFLAGERIADIRRDADHRRLTSHVARRDHATIHHREPSAPPSASPTVGRQGAG